MRGRGEWGALEATRQVAHRDLGGLSGACGLQSSLRCSVRCCAVACYRALQLDDGTGHGILPTLTASSSFNSLPLPQIFARTRSDSDSGTTPREPLKLPLLA